MSGDDDEVSPLADLLIGDARRVAIARAAGPLPITRTSHSSFDVGVNEEKSVVAAVAASGVVMRCCLREEFGEGNAGFVVDDIIWE